MNKFDIINSLGIRDADKENKIKRVFDQIQRVNKEFIPLASDFLSPDITGYIEKILYNFRDLSSMLVGGYDEAEYQILIVFPDYMEKDQIDISDYLQVLEITYNKKFGDVSHRDVLGSLMGQGIKREKVGDILLEEGKIQVMVCSELAQYLDGNLSKIGRVNVNTEIVSLENIIEKEYEVKEISTTVKSLRLDAIVSSGFNIPRSKAVELIKLERVKLNHSFVKSVSKEVEEGSLISVKGKGRIILKTVGGVSKKDRLRIEITRFL